PCPKCGSSDVAIGHLGRSTFIAAIEPWHGNETVVYGQAPNGWDRHVIDDSLSEGHTILTADFDRSGRDAIVAGFRGAAAHGVFLYELPLNPQPQKSAADP